MKQPKTIASARQRLDTAVRLTSQVYALKLYQSLDMAAYVPLTLDDSKKKMIYRFAWVELCEWISLGWDLSQREDLLAIWRKVSAQRQISKNLTKARIRAEDCGMLSDELRFLPPSVNYYGNAREDLQGLTDTSLREIPMEDGEFVWKPEGLDEFYKYEIVEIARIADTEDEFMRSTPLGRLFLKGLEDDSTEL